MKEAIMNIKGMSCRSCVNKIETGVSQVNGVGEAAVDFSNKQLHVKYDENEVTIPQLKEVIVSKGYSVD
ncbi:copper chaperone CopZ [Bacillus fengqiuensis]|nr:copper chaperone CopZ [Bacillus fengqiuensis]